MNKFQRIVLISVLALLIAASGAAVFVSRLPKRVASSGGLALGMMAPSIAPGAPMFEESADYAVARKGIIMPPEPPMTAGETAAETDQRIIKNGSLHLVVDDVERSAGDVADLAKRRGGFIQSSNIVERADGTHFGSVVFRVPVDEFESAMSEAKLGAKAVKSEAATGQDVTEQYTDLQAQLRNAKAQEEVYLQILVKAKTVEEILSVQQYLGSIRGQIESLEGRMKYLENKTSFSTIDVTLEEEPVVRVPSKEFRPDAAFKEALRALVALTQGAVIGLIWLVIVGGGLGIPAILIAWLIVRVAIRIFEGKSGSRR